jgi:glycosyltransferase involved in cell wall biosynthesis
MTTPYRYVPMKCDVQTLTQGAGTPQKPFALYAVLFTWYEEDIIGACVKNLLAEGADRVFLIDNGSPDATIERAVQSGAVHIDTIFSERFSESVKCGNVFAFVRKMLQDDPHERVWWLFCDADEFPTSPDNGTIRAYLEQLDDRVRVVGGHFINHYPVENPHYCSGFHPAEFQFRASQNSDDAALYCTLVHDKYNLIRFDNSEFDVHIHGGYHRFESCQELYEIPHGLYIHHFQYRNKTHTLKRLNMLVNTDENGCSRLGNSVYNQKIMHGIPMHMDWYIKRRERAYNIYKNKVIYEPRLFAWQNIMMNVNATKHMFTRWYSEETLAKAVSDAVPDDVFRAWRLTWLMLYKGNETFLEYYEKYENCRFSEQIHYAAQCYAHRGEAEKALRTLHTLPHSTPAARQLCFTQDSALSHIKKILRREAVPVAPL